MRAVTLIKDKVRLEIKQWQSLNHVILFGIIVLTSPKQLVLHKHKLDLYPWNPLKLQSTFQLSVISCQYGDYPDSAWLQPFGYFTWVYMLTPTYMWWVLSVQFSLDKCLLRITHMPVKIQETAITREFPCLLLSHSPLWRLIGFSQLLQSSSQFLSQKTYCQIGIDPCFQPAFPRILKTLGSGLGATARRLVGGMEEDL